MKFKLAAAMMLALGLASGQAPAAEQLAAGVRPKSSLIFCRWVEKGNLVNRGSGKRARWREEIP